MTIENVIFIVLVVLIAGVWPRWPYSAQWGYTPARLLTLVLMVFLLWDLSEGRFLSSIAGDDNQSNIYHTEKNLKRQGMR